MLLHRALLLICSALISASALPQAGTNGAAFTPPVDALAHPVPVSSRRPWTEPTELIERESLKAGLKSRSEQDAARPETLWKRGIFPDYNLQPEFVKQVKKLLNIYDGSEEAIMKMWERCMRPKLIVSHEMLVILLKVTTDDQGIPSFPEYLDRWQRQRLDENFNDLMGKDVDDCAKEVNRKTLEIYVGQVPVSGPDAGEQRSEYAAGCA